MRPTLNPEKAARQKLHEQQLREFLRQKGKGITQVPVGVSGVKDGIVYSAVKEYAGRFARKHNENIATRARRDAARKEVGA